MPLLVLINSIGIRMIYQIIRSQVFMDPSWWKAHKLAHLMILAEFFFHFDFPLIVEWSTGQFWVEFAPWNLIRVSRNVGLVVHHANQATTRRYHFVVDVLAAFSSSLFLIFLIDRPFFLDGRSETELLLDSLHAGVVDIQSFAGISDRPRWFTQIG